MSDNQSASPPHVSDKLTDEKTTSNNQIAALPDVSDMPTNDLLKSPVSSFYPADNPAVTAHITLMQGIITRLANNSVSCKTWCLTLVGALVSLAGATHLPGIITFALVPVIIFGFLDMMYLAQEKAYRDLYSKVISHIQKGSYDRKQVYEAKASKSAKNICQAFFSWATLPVYLGLIAAYLVARCAGWLALIATVSK